MTRKLHFYAEAQDGNGGWITHVFSGRKSRDAFVMEDPEGRHPLEAAGYAFISRLVPEEVLAARRVVHDDPEEFAQMMSIPEEFAQMMSIHEVYAITGLHERTIARHCRSGEIKAVRVGNRWLVDRAALMNQLGLACEGADND